MKIITDLSIQQLSDLLRLNTEGTVILKFGATWCSPCKQIEPVLNHWLQKFNDLKLPVLFCFLDIDVSEEIYKFYKNKKIIPGVPTIMSFHKGNISLYPDNIIIGSNINEINNFFTNEMNNL